MAVNFLTIFQMHFLMKIYKFRLRFRLNVYLMIGSDNGLAPDLNQCWLAYRRIYASRGVNELILLLPLRVESKGVYELLK